MKKFLIRLAIFVLPIIILIYPIDVFISHGLRHSTLCSGEIETWNDIYSGTVNSECLIYGSSRAWVHVDPRIIEEETGISTYNFGMDAHNFYMQRFRHQEYLKHNPKPKVIILTLDMGTLDKRIDLYNQDQFLPFMLWNKDIEKATQSYIGFDKIDFYMPLLRYVGRFDAIKSGVKYYLSPDSRFRYKGYKGNNLTWNNDLDHAKEQMSQYVVNIDTMSVQLFKEFIEECKDNDISLILVYTPEYIEGQGFTKNRKEIMAIYDNLAKEYDIPFLNYSNDSTSYKKEYFYNTMHMNKEGSQVFTRQLVQDLQKNGLLNK